MSLMAPLAPVSYSMYSRFPFVYRFYCCARAKGLRPSRDMGQVNLLPLKLKEREDEELMAHLCPCLRNGAEVNTGTVKLNLMCLVLSGSLAVFNMSRAASLFLHSSMHLLPLLFLPLVYFSVKAKLCRAASHLALWITRLYDRWI